MPDFRTYCARKLGEEDTDIADLYHPEWTLAFSYGCGILDNYDSVEMMEWLDHETTYEEGKPRYLTQEYETWQKNCALLYDKLGKEYVENVVLLQDTFGDKKDDDLDDGYARAYEIVIKLYDALTEKYPATDDSSPVFLPPLL